MTNSFYAKWKQYQYYIIIGILSFVALVFLPMLGSSLVAAWVLPTTPAGWVVYITTKLIVATLNLLIFHCFKLQAKVNIEDHPDYVAALQILQLHNINLIAQPRSPEDYNRAAYGKKGATIFITSILSAIGLTQAVLAFDLISMLTYFFTLLMGAIFGILEMNRDEIYWTKEFYCYARNIEKEQEEAKRKIEETVAMAAETLPQPANDTPCATGGSDLLVSPDSSGTSCDNSLA